MTTVRATPGSWANPAIWKKLDFSIIDTRDFLEVAKAPWVGGGGITWSTVLAYNANTYPNGLHNMSAYYDVVGYPGQRGLGLLR